MICGVGPVTYMCNVTGSIRKSGELIACVNALNWIVHTDYL